MDHQNETPRNPEHNALVEREQKAVAAALREWRGVLSRLEHHDIQAYNLSDNFLAQFPLDGSDLDFTDEDLGRELEKLAQQMRATVSPYALRIIDQVNDAILNARDPDEAVEKNLWRLAAIVDRGETPHTYVEISVGLKWWKAKKRRAANKQFWKPTETVLDPADQAGEVGELLLQMQNSAQSPGKIFERDGYEAMGAFIIQVINANFKHWRSSFYLNGKKVTNEVMHSIVHAIVREFEVRGQSRDEIIRVTNRDIREVTDGMRRLCQADDDWRPPQETIAIERSIMAQFIRECCVLESGAYVRTVDFRTAFNDYLNARGLPLMTPKQVGNLLSRETGGGITSKPAPRSFDSRQPRCYAGLRLR